MKYISLRGKLGTGRQTVVSQQDFSQLNKHRWYLDKRGYVTTRIWKNGHRTTVRMHRLILNCPKGKQVDHINHNPLDNQRENLRICTRLQNSQHRLKMPNTLYPYKGVRQKFNKWKAYITYKDKQYHIGYFDTIEQAALAYDLWATYFYGEFAVTNFPVVAYK